LKKLEKRIPERPSAVVL